MKGTDCTPEQLAAASDFLAIAKWPKSLGFRRCDRRQVANLLAWYGAMRYKAARDDRDAAWVRDTTLRAASKSKRVKL